MKGTYSFIVYAKDPPKSFHGILGSIDFHVLQLLLVGGKYIIEEQYSEKDPIKWYTSILEEQGIHIIQGKQQTYKGHVYIWLEVDTAKTPIQEFTSWKELDPSDTESLAWKSFYYACHAGTTKECIGLAVVAREIPLESVKSRKGKEPMYLNTVFDAILNCV
jgi:hypothetical protein